MLQCLLCASRFAHYLKVLSRDKLGQFTGPAECEAHLNNWLREYTTATADNDSDSALKRRYPCARPRCASAKTYSTRAAMCA